MANADLYNASDVFVSGHTTIQAAIDASASGYTIKVGDKGAPYYEVPSLLNLTNRTVIGKPGERPRIYGAIEELVTSPSGKWTLHGTVNGFVVYYYTYTYNPTSVRAVRDSSDLSLFTYSSWDLFVNGTAGERNHAGEGIYFDNAANKLFITLTGNANPNSVALRVSFDDYVFELKGADGCTLEDLDIQIAGEAVVHISNADDVTIRNCATLYAQRGIWIEYNLTACNNVLIEDNVIRDSWNPNWTYDDIKIYGSPNRYMEGSGVQQSAPGTGCIIRRNIASGWFHGINIKNTSSGSPFIDGTKIYENTIHDIRSDAFTVEYYSKNVQIFSNLTYDTHVAFAGTPHELGPTYFYRNRVICDKPFYTVGDAGHVPPRISRRSPQDTCVNYKIYHNTFYIEGGVGWQMNTAEPPNMINIELLNNIIVTDFDHTMNGTPLYTRTGNDIDGNCHYRLAPVGDLLNNFSDGSSDYASLAVFRASAAGIASGWELNGIQANPNIDLTGYPYGLTLTSASSPCIDAGVVLPVAFPDETIYGGDLTMGMQPYTLGGDPAAPVKSSGATRAATIITTGNQTFRDAQFHDTPNAAIFIITAAITDGTAADDAVLGIGFATGTTERVAVTQWDDNAAASTLTRRRSIEDGCIFIIGSTGTILAQGDIVGFEADAGAGSGVTVNWTVAPPAAYLLTVILFKAVSAKAGTFLTPATNGGTVSPSLGFPPDVVFCIYSGDAIPASAATAIISFGVVGRDLTQRCWATRSANAVADADLSAQYLTNRIAVRLQSGGTVLYATEITGMGATDFTATQRTVGGGTDEIGYLALEFGDETVWIGDVDTPIAIGIQTISSPALYPQLVIQGLTNTEAANTVYNDNRAGSIGVSVFTSYASYSNVIYSDDAAATTASKSLSDDTAIRLPNDDGAAQNVAALSQLTTTGWQMNHTAVAGVAKKVWAFALQGPEESVITSVPVYAVHYAKMRHR